MALIIFVAGICCCGPLALQAIAGKSWNKNTWPALFRLWCASWMLRAVRNHLQGYVGLIEVRQSCDYRIGKPRNRYRFRERRLSL